MKFYKLLMVIFFLVIFSGCQDSPDTLPNDSADQASNNPIVGTYFGIDGTEVSQEVVLKFDSDGNFEFYKNNDRIGSGSYEVKNGIIMVNLKKKGEDEIVIEKFKLEKEIIYPLSDPQARFIRKGFEDTVPELIKKVESKKAVSLSNIGLDRKAVYRSVEWLRNKDHPLYHFSVWMGGQGDVDRSVEWLKSKNQPLYHFGVWMGGQEV